jgi:hypothetical protein
LLIVTIRGSVSCLLSLSRLGGLLTIATDPDGDALFGS